jgi:hypothetical protein
LSVPSFLCHSGSEDPPAPVRLVWVYLDLIIQLPMNKLTCGQLTDGDWSTDNTCLCSSQGFIATQEAWSLPIALISAIRPKLTRSPHSFTCLCYVLFISVSAVDWHSIAGSNALWVRSRPPHRQTGHHRTFSPFPFWCWSI